MGRARGIARLDLEGLDTLPGRRWAYVAAVLVVGVVFSLAHVGIRDLYTESIPFLLWHIA